MGASLEEHSLNRFLIVAVAAILGGAAPLDARGATRSFFQMPTGNGHGFQVFERYPGRITSFLEHPHRFVAPTDATRESGVSRRDLAHDIYPGMRVAGKTHWLVKPSVTDYLEQTHVIRARTVVDALTVDVHYLAPFGFPGNAMLMILRVANGGAESVDLRLFSKPNLKLGRCTDSPWERADPCDVDESFVYHPLASPPHSVETGPGGGHVVTFSLGGQDAMGCGEDAVLHESAVSTGEVGTCVGSQGTSRVGVAARDLSIPAGEAAWWGTAVLFVNDTAAEPQSSWFADERTVEDLLAAWGEFAGERGPKELLSDALAEFEAWRTPMPDGLSEGEQKLWRQSEAVLRMGQIREPNQANRSSDGMLIAALPPGEWHTGWVRDGAYAAVALAQIGHVEEASQAIALFLGADAQTGGFFQGSGFIGAPYRISACRYFGNGMEEGDFNAAGPNVETDGWGLVLWAARMVADERCDPAWLDTPTLAGDSLFEGLHAIAMEIEALIDPATGLPGADASIWEVHWDFRQVFAYTTATQIRGLYDFAAIADWKGEAAMASHFRGLADAMLQGARDHLVYTPDSSIASHLGVADDAVHVDGSTVEFFRMGLIDVGDPIVAGTMARYDQSLASPGGGYRRLEKQLSLTGEAIANAYDLSEWVFLDLRIGEVWRSLGEDARADALLDRVTETALANDGLISELFEDDGETFAGEVPMVGYGAGLWMMAQRHRLGLEPSSVNAAIPSCGSPGEESGEESGERDASGTGSEPDVVEDAAAPGDAETGDSSGTGGGEESAESTSGGGGSACRQTSGPPRGFLWVLVGGCWMGVRLRRRQRGERA